MRVWFNGRIPGFQPGDTGSIPVTRTMNKSYILLVAALVFSVLRFFMPTHSLSFPGTYEAFAHLFLGGLIGAWAVSKEKFYMFLVVALSLVELAAFFHGRM
jgi:hypothetical protein